MRLSCKSCFCRAVVQCGILTYRQMVHAAWRYRLGRSKNDAVIYWQIDHFGREHDGKLMWYGPDCHRLKNRPATWVTFLLKKHFGFPQDAFQATHCLFGQHLLRVYPLPKETRRHRQPPQPPATVCIVEAEKSAVILSELFPQYIWMAAGGLFELKPEKLLPLKYYKIILLPDTDTDLKAFTIWYEVAQKAMKMFLWNRHNHIHVSDFLERHASPDQKRRKIDLVDYIIESTSILSRNQHG